MLAADAELHVVARAAATFGRDANEFAHSIEIERYEGIMLDDAFALVGGDEGGRVVA